MNLRDLPLGTLIVRDGIAEPATVRDALVEAQRTRRRLGEVMLANGWIRERDLARLLAEQKKLDFVDLAEVDLDDRAVDCLPESLARRARAVAYALNETSCCSSPWPIRPTTSPSTPSAKLPAAVSASRSRSGARSNRRCTTPTASRSRPPDAPRRGYSRRLAPRVESVCLESSSPRALWRVGGLRASGQILLAGPVASL